MQQNKLKCSINYHLKILRTYQEKYKPTDDFYIEVYNYLKELEKQYEFNSSQKYILYARNIEES